MSSPELSLVPYSPPTNSGVRNLEAEQKQSNEKK